MNGLLPFELAETPLVPPPDLTGVSTVTLDTETNGVDWVRGDRPVGIALGYGPERVYLPFAHRGGGNLDEGIVKRWAKEQLRGKHIVGFNTRFDIHMLRVWGVDLRSQGNTFHDVSHDGCLLNDHRPKSRLKLDHFAEDELGEGKENIGRPEHIADLPGNIVASYARRDIELTWRLHEAFQPRIKAEDLTRVQALEDACIPATVEMESHGLPLDLDTLHRWQKDLNRILSEITFALHKAAGFACTPSKKPDMARLFQAAGLTYGRTPTGLPEFPAEVVEAAALKSKTIELAYRWLKVQHLLSKIITPFSMRHVGGVLYPSFNQMMGEDGGTISGRYSSSNPNGQNLLNKSKYHRAYGWLREYTDQVFLARALVLLERGTWFNADQKQVEYRIAGHYADDPQIVDWYREDPNTDFHNRVMGLIQRVRRDITRDESKAPGFARLYGGTAGTVAHTLRITRDEAEVLIEQYDSAFPAFGRLFQRAYDVANARGYVKTFLGRRCRFEGTPGRRQRCHKALNHICQGTGADLAKQALVAVYEQRKALGVTMRVTEHDAIGGDLEGPTKPLLDLLNEQRLPLKIPITWDMSTGRSWADAKG